MYNQPEEILEKYALTATQITRGRGFYICDTNQGIKLLMPYRGSRERALFLRQFLQYLQEEGFAVEQILLTAEGEPFAEDGYGEKYLCKDAFIGTEMSTHNREDMKAAVRTLALYHRLSQGCALLIPECITASENNTRLLYEKRLRQMRRLKNYICHKNKRNAFEELFRVQVPRFMEQAQKAVELLEQEDADGLSEKQDKDGLLTKTDADGLSEPEKVKMQRMILCHGDFNQHNMIRTKEGWRMVHFEHLCLQDPMLDLSGFLRKILEKNNWRQQLGQELIEAYDAVEPMSETDRRHLYIQLLFPEKFAKLANRYANSNKAWLSERSQEKLERLIAQENSKEHFLEKIL